MENRMTIREVSELWKKDKQPYVKASTFAAYVLTLENHILPDFGDKHRFVEAEVQDFALRKLQGGLGHKSVKTVVVVLKMVQKFGAKNGFLPAVVLDVKLPAEQVGQGLDVLSVAHQRRIMQHATDHFSFRNLGICICLSTGMRIGEVCALKWGDINLQTETISITRTIARIYVVDKGRRHTQLVIGSPKTRKSIREVPMSRGLLKIIRPLKKVMNDDFFVLTNAKKPTEPRIYRNYYKQLLRQLDIAEQKFHGLRHSFATRCIESQCDYKTVSELLGHANIATTLNLYVHPSMEQKKRCIDLALKPLETKL